MNKAMLFVFFAIAVVLLVKIAPTVISLGWFWAVTTVLVLAAAVLLSILLQRAGDGR